MPVAQTDPRGEGHRHPVLDEQLRQDEPWRDGQRCQQQHPAAWRVAVHGRPEEGRGSQRENDDDRQHDRGREDLASNERRPADGPRIQHIERRHVLQQIPAQQLRSDDERHEGDEQANDDEEL